MPLITMTGLPCCGKTKWSEVIRDTFLERIKNSEDARIQKSSVILINDETLGIDKSSYAEARSEKAARGLLFSAVERHLGKECIVICDGLNYIKGFRYQLSCSAKALGTPHCLVHVGRPIDRSREENEKRAHGYPAKVFEELLMRYEEPNPMTKWDSPCFTIPAEDTDPPIEDIWDAMVNKKIARPHAATLMRPAVETDYLYKLDKVTQDIVTKVLDAQKLSGSGGAIPISSMSLELPGQAVNIAGLQRLRRQFMSINRNLMVNETGRIQQLFVEFLNEQWS
jgi:protein KTI12